jgi:hypothetical protein
MAPAWTESKFRQYLHAIIRGDTEFVCKVLHPNVIVRYPGVPDIIGREAWLNEVKELTDDGLDDVEVSWFVGEEGKHAALLKSTIFSRITVPKRLTFLNVQKGDSFTHSAGAFVFSLLGVH